MTHTPEHWIEKYIFIPIVYVVFWLLLPVWLIGICLMMGVNWIKERI